jgi:hypothetical protein
VKGLAERLSGDQTQGLAVFQQPPQFSGRQPNVQGNQDGPDLEGGQVELGEPVTVGEQDADATSLPGPQPEQAVGQAVDPVCQLSIREPPRAADEGDPVGISFYAPSKNISQAQENLPFFLKADPKISFSPPPFFFLSRGGRRRRNRPPAAFPGLPSEQDPGHDDPYQIGSPFGRDQKKSSHQEPDSREKP